MGPWVGEESGIAMGFGRCVGTARTMEVHESGGTCVHVVMTGMCNSIIIHH